MPAGSYGRPDPDPGVLTGGGELSRRWCEAVAVLAGAPGPAAEAAADLEARYGQGHRRYHGSSHVLSALRSADDLAGELGLAERERALLTLAVAAHDVVYRGVHGQDEADSAGWARDALAACGLDPLDVEVVAAAVLATTGHTGAAGDPVLDCLLDADLSILGAAPDVYAGYQAGVRAEYGHLEEAAWRAGRRAMLEGFLARPALYRTAEARRRWEAAARRNMQAELERMGFGSSPSSAAAAAPRSLLPRSLLRRGYLLEGITLGWNVVGIVVLALAALAARSVALAGFGLDSLIEIGASTVVIRELSGTGEERRRRALRLIGAAFLVLALYLAIQSGLVLAAGYHPKPSRLGIVWTGFTAVAMFTLASGKARLGRRLDNPVLRTEGRVTLVDGLLATAVLVGLVLNDALGWWWADPAAAVVILFYGLKEGREAWGQE